MTLPKDDVCYGCIFTHGPYEIECSIRKKGFKLECPCIKCFIIILCEDACEEYYKVLSKSRQNDGVIKWKKTAK